MATQSPDNPAPNPVSPVFIPADWNLTTAKSSATNTKNQRIIGQVIMVARTSLPSTNWLWCDGTSYSTSQYAELFATIGYTYTTGGGGGSTFQVPNFLGKSPVGTDAVATLSTTYQGTAGVVSSGNRTISVAQLASHAHDFTHTHGYSWNYANLGNQKTCSEIAGGITVLQNIGGGTGNGNTTGIQSGQTPDAGNNTASTGSNTEILPPFSIVAFCIRAS
jgi:microcystin-dependent protein